MADGRVDFPLGGRRVFVAGHRGMAGSALVRRLEREGCTVLAVPRSELDLRDQAGVEAWMQDARPDVVVAAAATVGGIYANSTRPAEFLYDNVAIAANLIHSAWRVGVAKLLFLGSSCIYPREAPQPMVESALLTGPLEPTNEWYAIAKIAGIKLCQAYRRQYGCDFISAMPTNLYGPGDRYDLTQGHVVAALIKKIHAAKVEKRDTVSLWGTGAPQREFLSADDLADACVFLLRHYSGEQHVNVGTGIETSIRELAETLARIIGFDGRFVYDTSMPDGAPRKVLDVSVLEALGWRAATPLDDGLRDAYAWFLAHVAGDSD